ncbi:MAG: sulfur carrier protein ThiS [Planctomycetes bacterium]|jgi:thiamine biosynthesis protein ThiS|nr:sulfur carrier protein ThiS [Planctomycetota bacterium]
MKLTLNGATHETEAGTVSDLIAELGLAGQAVAVEINQQVVPKKQHDQTSLHDGDKIELVTLVGGG